MIESLLVANRGEIACRIFRTARRLGIRTIAVFSDADTDAQHVREADVAVRIGPPPPRQSYLNIASLLEAARTVHAEAIHPGYGFLAENAQFAQACLEAGVLFVGPPAAAIAAMGSKIHAKARMRAIGVPVLPGYEGAEQDLEHLQSAARRLGMPLMIKPAAGGGGKGMRIVTSEGEIAAALAAARRLAQSAFGDGSLLLERFLPAPRHVEVQIFADQHGNFVHLGDRDCSIQRRHQKLLEEAPAPNLPDALRTAMRSAALLVAREIGYVSAGTVEFLFDGSEFYFMEMNTRLQVEHTVTESVTALDLVEWQLRVAAGEPLPLDQAQIQLTGHAIEARVCAEDPRRDFLPSAGTLQLMHWPAGEGVRVDAGFATGDRVPDDYDSLLGKVIAGAPSRAEAAARLGAALRRTYCAGVHTNERWLAGILDAPEFRAAAHSIAFLEQHGLRLREPELAGIESTALAALLLQRPSAAAEASPWEATDGFIPNLPAWVERVLAVAARRYRVRTEFEAGLAVAVILGPAERDDGAGATRLPVTQLSVCRERVAATLAGIRVTGRYLRIGQTMHLWLTGGAHDTFTLEDPRETEFTVRGSQGTLTTPLPGVVTAVAVTPGQTVAAGEVLMSIEAMKMEHTITAPFAGTVLAIHFAVGDRVPEGSELLELAGEDVPSGERTAPGAGHAK